jgi:hypothetical protein
MAKSPMCPDPEVAFFRSLPGAPVYLDMPSSVAGLAAKKGITRVANAGRFSTTHEEWWDEWLLKVPRAGRWFATPQAMAVPKHWPPALEEVVPASVTPRVWWSHMAPQGSGLHGARRWLGAEGGIITAISMGWVPSERELQKACWAAGDLLEVPAYVVWAYNLDLDRIPLPMSGSGTLRQKLDARHRLQEKPLLTGRQLEAQALPPGMRDGVRLLVTCPRRSNEVSRRIKRPLALPDQPDSGP